MMKVIIKLEETKRKNPIAKDLRTPKYKMRVVISKKIYKRIKKVNYESE